MLKDKIKQLELSSGHFGIMIVSAVVLILLIAMQGQVIRAANTNPTNISPSNVVQAPKVVSTVATTTPTPVSLSQQVLGASTVNQSILQPFETQNVLLIDNNTSDGFQNYIDQITQVFNANDAHDLVLEASTVQNKTAEMQNDEDRLVAEISHIAAPSALIEYQRMMLAYYFINFQDTSTDDHTQIQTTILPAISQRLTELRDTARTQLGIYLPDIQ